MKPFTAEYQESMRENMRNRSYARIFFKNIDTEAAGDGVWEASGLMPWSGVDTLDYPFAYGETIATLELNRWALDGTSAVWDGESKVNDGLVLDVMSDENGRFGAMPSIRRRFNSPHTFRGLTVTFDARMGEWPRQVTASYYLDGRLVNEQSAYPDDVIGEIPNESIGVNEVILRFGELLPYHRPRVQYIMFGYNVEFTNEVIASMREKTDVDPITRRLPTETFEFTLLDYEQRYNPDNPDGDYAYVDEKSPVSVQYGYELPDKTIEWLKPDKYLLTGKPVTAPNRATFRATGTIGSMNGAFYKSKTGEKTLYDMAEEVLMDAGLEPTETGENPWVIDPALKNMTTEAVLPIDTHAKCLQLIAHAACAKLYTDDDNVIHIEPFGVTVEGIYSGPYTDNGHVWYSDAKSMESADDAGLTYATLELNRWALDGGNTVVIPDEQHEKTGFTSSAESNIDGIYGTNPAFRKKFDRRHDVRLIILTFDPISGEYPDKVRAVYYRNGEVVTYKDADVTSEKARISNVEALDIDEIEIFFLSSGLPYRRARASKITYRETDLEIDFSTMVGNDYQYISKIDQLKRVDVARYSYLPEEVDANVGVEDLDTQYF